MKIDRAIIFVIKRRQSGLVITYSMAIWLGHNLQHGNLVPSVVEGRIIRRGHQEGVKKERWIE